MRALRIALTALALATLWAPPSSAADPLDKLDRGAKVGERIPHALTAVDHTGKQQDFRSLKGGRGLVILFNRSVDW
jgi:hypothetical protein